MTNETFNLALAFGDINIIKWLHDNNCNWNSSACEYVAKNGRLDILQYLYNNGYLKHNSEYEDVCNYASLGGHSDIVHWLHENINIP